MDNNAENEITYTPTHLALLIIRRDGYMRIVEEITNRAKGSTDMNADEIEFWAKQTELMVEIMRNDNALAEIESQNRLDQINAAIIEVEEKARTAHLN